MVWFFWTGPTVNRLRRDTVPEPEDLTDEQALTFCPDFKAKVAMAAISGRKTIQEIGTYTIHPNHLSEWKRQMLDIASELFTSGNKSKDT